MNHQITLQINLSPGDINYAQLTVPALVASHADIPHRLLVVDCCKPQKTKIVDPDIKFPEPLFKERVRQIKSIANNLLKEGVATEVYFLEPGDPLIAHISKKYFRNIVKETHEYGGIGISSYLAGLELTKTRSMLHFDGDMLFHQSNGFKWYEHALRILEANPDCISATPGIAPLNGMAIQKPSLDHWSAFTKVAGGYKDTFFSARQFLIDKQRLARYLPLLKGPALWETLLVKYLNRGYPRAVENIFFKRFRSAGAYRFMLESENCWVLHPLQKPEPYLAILPAIIEKVYKGDIPKAQLGHENIQLEAWQSFLKEEN